MNICISKQAMYKWLNQAIHICISNQVSYIRVFTMYNLGSMHIEKKIKRTHKNYSILNQNKPSLDFPVIFLISLKLI